MKARIAGRKSLANRRGPANVPRSDKQPRVVKAGRPRKSRRLRLNISSGSGSDIHFTPEPIDWERIERAYGHSLTPDDREAITALVENYFRWQPSEAKAPYLDDALAYLNRLEKAGQNFWRMLLELSHTPMSGTGDHAHIAERDSIRRVAVGFVQSHVGRHLKQFDYRKQTDWHGLLDIMQACVPAFEATKKYLSEEAARVGFVEGRAWAELVWRLTEFSKQRKLPSGASKRDDPQQAYPFVAFFRELQRTFPVNFHRHEGSNAALAQAITVARHQTKRSLAWREARKTSSAAQPS
jgi:hypothetical protein